MPNPQQAQPLVSYLAGTTNQIQNTGTSTTDSLVEFSANLPQNVFQAINTVSLDTSTAYNNANAGEFRRSYRYDYDFATDGPAGTTTVTLRGGTIPIGFVVVTVELWVQTALTTGSSQTMALTAAGVTVTSATVTSTDGTAGYHVFSPTAARVTTAGKMTLAIGTAAITGGAFVARVNGFYGVVDTSSAAGT